MLKGYFEGHIRWKQNTCKSSTTCKNVQNAPWEIKGQFRKRVVLANVPSFRFFVPREHANVPSFRFSFRGNIRMYPRSGFRSGGTSAKTALLENHPFGNPRNAQLGIEAHNTPYIENLRHCTPKGKWLKKRKLQPKRKIADWLWPCQGECLSSHSPTQGPK